MIVVAGANGTGKSTLCATRVAPNFTGPFINADIIQRDELGDASPDRTFVIHWLTENTNGGFDRAHCCGSASKCAPPAHLT
jgi:hypothetical protein